MHSKYLVIPRNEKYMINMEKTLLKRELVQEMLDSIRLTSLTRYLAAPAVILSEV